MNLKSYVLLIVFHINILSAQSIQHRWHVIDRGGGRSTTSGVILQASIGQPVVAVMSATGTSLENGYIPGIRQLSGATSTFDYLPENGWNMISVPLLVADYHKNVLYPSAVSNAFGYSGGYVVQTTLQNGVGYWLRFPSSNIIETMGTGIARETVTVTAGWNMVGCASYPVLRTDIDLIGTTLTSPFFGYSNAYFPTDQLQPGYGYWIKVSAFGKIVLKTGSVITVPAAGHSATQMKTNGSPARETDQDALSNIRVRDAAGREATLYFAVNQKEINVNQYVLPPPPPQGIMDVRFPWNSTLAVSEKEKSRDVGIQVSSAIYPLTVKWKIEHGEDAASLLIGGEVVSMKSNGETQATNPELPIRLRLSPASPSVLPKEFALSQNYPNPFNPMTVIRYQLPVISKITLRIYNVLGQEVKTLVDEIRDAGYGSVEWNSTNNTGNPIASGVYIYRLEATSVADPSRGFTQVHTMVLLK